MKPSDLKTAEDALAEDLQNPEFRHEWERTALARAVSERLVQYRIEHGLTQMDAAVVECHRQFHRTSTRAILPSSKVNLIPRTRPSARTRAIA